MGNLLNRGGVYIIGFVIICVLMVAEVVGQEEEGVRDLGGVFDMGYILQDRNGDGVVDYVDVQIVVGESPSRAALASAANVAARLGYETTGVDLDLVVSRAVLPGYSSGPLIAIGVGANGAEALAPGQGRVRFAEGDENLRGGVVTVEGADDTGLMGAANYLAGRYPNLWGMKGKTLGDMREQLGKFLAQREIETERVFLDYVDVDAVQPGVLKLAVQVELAGGEDFRRALRALEGEEDPNAIKEFLQVKDLEFKDVNKLAVEVRGGGGSKVIYLQPEKAWNTAAATQKAPAANRDFSLWQLYSTDGLLRDTNRDNLADDIAGYISLGAMANANNAANLAARLGLESAGVKIPLALVAGEEEHPEKYGFAVLMGTDHFMVRRLQEEGKLYGLDESGAGYVQLVRGGLNGRNGLVIGGGSQAGLDSAVDYVTKRMPYLWEYGKGNFELEEVEKDVREFFGGVRGEGQVALGLEKLETWLGRLEGEDIEAIEVELAAEKTPGELEGFTEDLIGEYFGRAETEVKLTPTGYGVGKEIFRDEIDIPWEVDDFWRLFRGEALPEIESGSRGKVTVLVSESPEVRARLRREIERELRGKGVATGAIEVVVLCAYKPGYSWLYDEILPKITGEEVGKIEIRYHTLKDSKEVRWQTISANTRWVQELFPIDEVLARELGIDKDAVTFGSKWEKEPIYEVRVLDEANEVILEEGFSPRYVVQPFFEIFEEYEQVRVTTGGVKAEIDGRVILDRRIATDLERFWEHFQKVSYRKLVDYVMDVQEGRPSGANAPFFDEFRVKVTLSEPSYRIGVDQELISSLDALHEDIMFETLTLFKLIGGRWGGGSLSYPGRIIPLVQAAEDGKPGRALIELTGKAKAKPEIKFGYTVRGKELVRKSYGLGSSGATGPRLTGIWVEPQGDGVKQLMFEVGANEPNDLYERYKKRAAESRIDSTYVSVGRLAGMARLLGEMHAAGIFTDKLSYDRVGNILLRVVLENEKIKEPEKFAREVNWPRTAKPKATARPQLYDSGFQYQGQQVIEWKGPLNPGQVAEKLAELNTFKEINVYHVARSFLGHDVFGADLYPAMEAEFVSQAKLSVLKPTLFLGGRVHGNEVSSTSHILRLAELCATDEEYKALLQKANLVLYPVVNPDGAQLAWELWQETPNFMLHAGRYGALGTDVGGGGRNSRYPEAGMVSRLRGVWQPDIAIDLHGVPHHEWVQHFAGYSGWVTSRTGGARSYWLTRAWYIPGFSWLEDERNQEAQKVHKAITDAMLDAVNAVPEVAAANQRIYDRYIKYGQQDEDTFFTYFYKDIQLESGISPRRAPSQAVTYYSLTTEAGDETAEGDWMELVCRAGLGHTTALLKYLAEGVSRVEREAKEFQGQVTRSVSRQRPILPKEEKKDKDTDKK